MKEYNVRGLSNKEVQIAYTALDKLMFVIEKTPYCIKHECRDCKYEKLHRQLSCIKLDLTYELERIERGERNDR